MALNFNNNSVTSVNYNGNIVNIINLNGTEVWSSGPAPAVDYFYIKCTWIPEPEGEGDPEVPASVELVDGGSGYYPTLMYSYDNGETWEEYDGNPYDMYTDDILYFKAGPNGNVGIQNGNLGDSCNVFNLTGGTFEIGGDITTLLNANGNISDLRTIGSNGFHFQRLFYGQSALYNIANLKMPAIIDKGSFHSAFMNTSIQDLPDLTTIQYIEYNGMGSTFRSCANLDNTTVADFSGLQGFLNADGNTYQYGLNATFRDSALAHIVLGPALPVDRSFNQTCIRCSSLQSVTVPWETWGDNSCQNWMSEVSGTGNFYCPVALGTYATITRGINNCPTGWNVINTDAEPFWVEFLENGYLSMGYNGTGYAQDKVIQLSTDQNTWSATTVNYLNTYPTARYFSQGTKVYIRSNSSTGFADPNTLGWAWFDTNFDIFKFTDGNGTNVKVNIGGRFASLFNDNMTDNGSGFCLFDTSGSDIVNAGDLIFPQNTTEWCYCGMFGDNHYLVTAPNLPAPIVADNAYRNMFGNCVELVAPPHMWATSLGETSCDNMFINCQKLATPVDISSVQYFDTNACNGMYNLCDNCRQTLSVINAIDVGNYALDMQLPISSSNFSTTQDSTHIYPYMITISGTSYSPITLGPNCTVLPNTQYYTDIPLDNSIFWVMPITQNGTLKLERKKDPNNAYRRSLNKKLSYKIDYGQWTSITENNFINTGISVSMGQKIYLKSSTNTAFDLWQQSTVVPSNSYETAYGFKFVGGNWSIGGDTASLFNYGSIPSSALSKVFNGCTNLVDASQLKLLSTAPHTVYAGMFGGCTHLMYGPQVLPAETVEYFGYSGMFSGCTALVTAPQIMATSLTGSNAMGSMFQGCTSLEIAPQIVVTTITGTRAMYRMFYGCTSLQVLPKLFTETLSNECYWEMFYGCSDIMLSTTQVGDYQTAYRIPFTGTGTSGTNSLLRMFDNTGGTFEGTPTINTTYYTSNEVI